MARASGVPACRQVAAASIFLRPEGEPVVLTCPVHGAHCPAGKHAPAVHMQRSGAANWRRDSAEHGKFMDGWTLQSARTIRTWTGACELQQHRLHTRCYRKIMQGPGRHSAQHLQQQRGAGSAPNRDELQCGQPPVGFSQVREQRREDGGHAGAQRAALALQQLVQRLPIQVRTCTTSQSSPASSAAAACSYSKHPC